MPIARNANHVAFTVFGVESQPALGLILGYGATVPFIAARPEPRSSIIPRSLSFASTLSSFGGAAILLFLAGVRRGLSFRTPGGATAGQIAASLWYFAAGFGFLLCGLFMTL